MDISEVDPLVECLLVLASYHGGTSSREALVAGLPLDNGSLSPSLFARAASRAGLVSKIVHKPLSGMNQALLPAVLLLEDNQVCLLMAWSPDTQRARVIYPELSEAVVDVAVEELMQGYGGTAILCRPKFRFDARAPRLTEHARGHWFWDALKENLPIYRDVLLAALFINIFALALPIFTMNVYDRVVPNQAVETLWMLAVGVGLVLLADLGLKTMRAYFLDMASQRVDINLSTKIMEKVLGLRMEARPLSAGSFAANLRSFETVRDFITSSSITAVIDLPFALLFILVIAWIAPLMLVPLLVGVCIVLGYAWITQPKMKALTETTYRASAMRNATLIESLVGLDTIKAMSAEGVMQKRWEQSASFLAKVGVQLRLISTSNVNVASWAQQLVSVMLIITGVYLIVAGELSMGGLIACSMLAGRVMGPFSQLAGLLLQYHNAATAMEALEDIMAKPVERAPDSNFLSRDKLKGKIEFRNVSFAYPGSEMPALSGVSFSIEPGEHVAVLGRVGSGKTTLQKLGMGLYQPTEGSILVDGVDMRQLDPAELRSQVGYVPQDVTLFYGTLRENIVLAHPLADDAAVLRAAELANLDVFVNNHPKGFDLLVGERGDSLSGGQRKAVAIARAVIHEPPILLMDEPTGSMDHSTEAVVRAKLREFAAGKTLLVVTHRTSLLEMVDRILVVDNGKIVADGPRDEVMASLRSGAVVRAS